MIPEKELDSIYSNLLSDYKLYTYIRRREFNTIEELIDLGDELV